MEGTSFPDPTGQDINENSNEQVDEEVNENVNEEVNELNNERVKAHSARGPSGPHELNNERVDELVNEEQTSPKSKRGRKIKYHNEEQRIEARRRQQKIYRDRKRNEVDELRSRIEELEEKIRRLESQNINVN